MKRTAAAPAILIPGVVIAAVMLQQDNPVGAVFAVVVAGIAAAVVGLRRRS